jgi:hypothetical protein
VSVSAPEDGLVAAMRGWALEQKLGRLLPCISYYHVVAF